MSKRKDIKKILVVGAGPIIIGQACEFDYSGTQACKALKDEGFKVILINFGDKEFVIKNKDRIAQMVFATIEKPTLRLSSKLAESKRNTGGFGSTGK